MDESKNIIKKNLKGIIYFRNDSKSYCFINTLQNDTFYCLRSSLLPGIIDGTKVEFDIVESYDFIKGKASYQAINVRIAPIYNKKHEKYLEAIDKYRDYDEEFDETKNSG